jgi:hypothetical protein
MENLINHVFGINKWATPLAFAFLVVADSDYQVIGIDMLVVLNV